MKMSYQGRAFLAREEGCVLAPYKDSVGVWTIGIGHAATGGPPPVSATTKPITLDAAFDLFATDLVRYENRVDHALTLPVSQNVYDACVSFDYNTGAIDKASFVHNINAGDMTAAGIAIMLWNKPPEIIGRRTREKNLLMTGDYGDIRTIPVWERQGGPVKAMALPQPTVPVQPPVPAPAPTPQPAPKPTPAPPPQPSLPPQVVPAGKKVAAGGLIFLILAFLATQWHAIWVWLTHLFGG